MTMVNNTKSSALSASQEDDFRSVQKRQRAIGRQLRGLFDDVVAEGVPSEFEDLLDRLHERETMCGGALNSGHREAAGPVSAEVRVAANGSRHAR